MGLTFANSNAASGAPCSQAGTSFGALDASAAVFFSVFAILTMNVNSRSVICLLKR